MAVTCAHFGISFHLLLHLCFSQRFSHQRGLLQKLPGGTREEGTTHGYNETSGEIKSSLWNQQWGKDEQKIFHPLLLLVCGRVCVSVAETNCCGRLNSTLGNCSHWHGSSIATRQSAKSMWTEIKGCTRWGLNPTVLGGWLEDKRLHKIGLLIAPCMPYLEAFVVCVVSHKWEQVYKHTQCLSSCGLLRPHSESTE